MINIIILLNEIWIDISTYSNRIFDPQYNITNLGNKTTFSTNISFWLIDSKIYSLFLGYKDFGFNLKYYDFGKFQYQSEFVNDEQMLTFSPFTIYASISKKLEIEKNLFFGISFGYYENRILNEVFASPFISISSYLNPSDYIKFLFSIESFSFKKLFSANQVELPHIISFAINSNLNQFSISAGFNKYYKFEKFISIEYKFRNLNLGFVFTPDYDYSKISSFIKMKYKNFQFGYKVYIPSYLNFTNTISLSYETP
ncbi:MAG: hypothetical protein ABIL37_03625 [candidate division WOR-3 bacterium]